jgi:hypothetical protein
MKTRCFSYLLAGCAITVTAWLVHGQRQEAPEGLPEKYQGTVHKALEYLAKAQHADGHWEGDGGQHPVAMTGLVGLALLMEKENAKSRGQPGPFAVSTHHAQIRKAADWLLAQSQAEREGLLFSGHASETTRYMEGHGLATLFLTGALAEERADEVRAKKLSAALGRAARYIIKARSSQGGWYHTSKVEGHDFADPLVTVIQIQALHAASGTDVAIPDNIGNLSLDAQQYLMARLTRGEKEKPDRRRVLDTAAALALISQPTPFSGREHEDFKTNGLKLCEAEIPRGRALEFGLDELTHYYYAQALFLRRNAAWTIYRAEMFDHLQSTQKADGSWPAASGLGVGSVYATALWCTLLQLDHNSHPVTYWTPVAVD